MSDPASIAQMQVEQLIDAIGGKDISPGAGSAGAVTLALAAACGAKAASISVKHHPDHAGLRRSLEALERIGRFALAGADADAEAFTAFIKDHRLGTVAQLIREGDKLSHLIDVLSATLEDLEPRVDANMVGDIVAARALMQAARTIQRTNSTAAREEHAVLKAQ
jgi:formiminotetrahydrofolate cyclodeaminase